MAGGIAPGRLLPLLLALTLAFRGWLAATMPITGDEAYFVEWGRHPDWGFYDHPPMIGWWLAALLHFSDAVWWLRLPALIQPAVLAVVVAWALPRLWPDVDEERRRWAALLVLLAPVNVWNVFVTTDTPLIYCCVFSGLAWIRASQDDDSRWYLVAGLFLAGAVLSKYFAALLGFAYLVDVLLNRRHTGWKGLAIAYACTVPALALMAWWNAGHCWTNYLFNFVNRHDNAGWSWRTPPLYLATLAYVITPPALWLLLMRGGGALTVGCRSTAVLSWAPFALFGLLSLVKQIGLHWLLAFVPFALMPLARGLPRATLGRLGKFCVVFALLHVVAILGAASLPLERWRDVRVFESAVLTFRTDALLDALAPFEKDYALASDGYSNAVILGFHAQRRGTGRVMVFGEASSHARHDDIQTDFRALEGRNILVVRKSPPLLDDYRPYFRAAETRELALEGAVFHLVLGRGFDYAAYREGVLATVKRKYYAIPAALPQTACYFCDRYFPGGPCRK